MKTNTFSKLAPFIQDYIYKNNWTDLRDIQVASCDVIFNSDANLLLTSSTASGKTEAAFLPVLTDIYNNPAKSVSILYISPLKALINDQFTRLKDLLEEAELSVTKWHGDSSQNKKDKILINPNGIIQITPESLEALIMNKPNDVYTIFNDLRYIIIDEVHYFIGTERGIQLESCLTRLSRIINKIPRRVGLSATLGDYKEVEKWLNSGTNRECITPIVASGKRTISLAIESFDDKADFYNSLYTSSLNQKCIIFSNSRSNVEENISSLKEIAKEKKTDDIYYTHHGSVNTSLREQTEDLMKNTDKKIVTGATLTLELGIDLGNLDRIIQTSTPFSVSSFVQRLGRTGRRGNKAIMQFLFDKSEKEKSENFYENIDFDIIMCIAIIEIYLKEKWVEPMLIPKYPYEILYHQTLSYITSIQSIQPKKLAEYMLTIDIFKDITKEDYKMLLNHLLEIGHLALTDSQELIIGSDIDKMINNYKFFSVFQNKLEYIVYGDSKQIGTITESIKVGEKLKLAGRTWEVTSIDNDKFKIYTKLSSGTSNNIWKSDAETNIDFKIIHKIYEILNGNEEYIYLQDNVKSLLKTNREIFSKNKLNNKMLVSCGDDKIIFPWLGTKSLLTLSYILKSEGINNNILKCNGIPIGLKIDNLITEIWLKKIVEKILNNKITIDEIKLNDFNINKKYSEFIPDELKEKEFRYDYLDLEKLKEEINL
ncbi:MAG: DEAD/DEAH box helicase [Bacilli bacterium]|nr:DEAD/DEAH box helicase [Bacilli bacterium]